MKFKELFVEAVVTPEQGWENEVKNVTKKVFGKSIPKLGKIFKINTYNLPSDNKKWEKQEWKITQIVSNDEIKLSRHYGTRWTAYTLTKSGLVKD